VEKDGNNITLSTVSAEWLLPSSGKITISVGGSDLAPGEFSYDPSTGIIKLNTDKTGTVVITAVAEKMLDILTVTVENDGTIKTKKGTDAVADGIAADTVILLENDINIENVLKGLRSGLTEDEVLTALGLGTKDALAAAVVKAGNDKMLKPAGTNDFILYLKVETGKVTAAGVGKNTSEFVQSYSITVDSGISGGTVKVEVNGAEVTSAVAGATVTLTGTPVTDGQTATFTVTGADSSTIAVNNGQFTMPAQNVTVTATFS